MEDFFKNMMSCGNLVKYLRCDNAGEHKSKLQRACEKETVASEYTTPHTPQLSDVIKRRLSAIKKEALKMLLNAKINDTAQKMLWAETVHTCECIRNSMATMGSTKSPFEKIYGEKPKIVVRSQTLDASPTLLNRKNLRSR